MSAETLGALLLRSPALVHSSHVELRAAKDSKSETDLDACEEGGIASADK